MEAEERFSAEVALDYDAGRELPPSVATAIGVQLPSLRRCRGVELLEVGAGTGGLALRLARDWLSYVAVDASAPMLKRFRSRLGGAAGPTLLQADMTALPLRSASFDCVLAVRVFGVVPGWRRGIGECVRVLRSGGLIMVGRVQHEPGSLHDVVRRERNQCLESLGIDSGRPGAEDDAVHRALSWVTEPGPAVASVVWTVRTAPREQVERNLSGWRVRALDSHIQGRIRSELLDSLTRRFGSVDRELEEKVSFVLHCYQKR